MHKKLPELSIFFPFWNEEDNIEQVVLSAVKTARSIASKWEIIIVDDGSSDNTLKIAANLAKREKGIRLLSHGHNRGYGAAIRSGLDNASYKTIVFTDGDGQFDFSEVTKFIDKIDNSDIVIGFRKKRRDSNIFRRLLLMNLLKFWDLILFRFYFRDIDCGFKMFRKDAIDKLVPLRSEGAMITTEILAKAKKKNLKISEVGVTHYPRTKGTQTGANFPVIMRAVLESFVLWQDLHYGRT